MNVDFLVRFFSDCSACLFHGGRGGVRCLELTADLEAMPATLSKGGGAEPARSHAEDGSCAELSARQHFFLPFFGSRQHDHGDAASILPARSDGSAAATASIASRYPRLPRPAMTPVAVVETKDF